MSTIKLGPLAQISRTVRDIKESEAWYARTLGLPHLYSFSSFAFFDCGGTRLYLHEQEKPGPESILYLRVDDIRAAYDTLRTRGVEFVDAPHMIHLHADGIEEWMAHFNDPEGRPLAIIAQARRSRIAHSDDPSHLAQPGPRNRDDLGSLPTTPRAPDPQRELP